MSARSARIIEAGNGWPRVGDLLRDGDGEVWRLVSDTGHIHTAAPGRGNYILGTVARAEEPEHEDDVFAARLELARGA